MSIYLKFSYYFRKFFMHNLYCDNRYTHNYQPFKTKSIHDITLKSNLIQVCFEMQFTSDSSSEKAIREFKLLFTCIRIPRAAIFCFWNVVPPSTSHTRYLEAAVWLCLLSACYQQKRTNTRPSIDPSVLRTDSLLDIVGPKSLYVVQRIGHSTTLQFILCVIESHILIYSFIYIYIHLHCCDSNFSVRLSNRFIQEKKEHKISWYVFFEFFCFRFAIFIFMPNLCMNVCVNSVDCYI